MDAHEIVAIIGGGVLILITIYWGIKIDNLIRSDMISPLDLEKEFLLRERPK